MHRFVLLALFAVGLADFPAQAFADSGDVVKIDCIRSGDPLSIIKAPSQDTSTVHPGYCPENASPSVAGLTQTVTVFLSQPPDCTQPFHYALFVNGLPTGIANNSCDAGAASLSFVLTTRPSRQGPWPEYSSTDDLWRQLLHNPWDAPGQRRTIAVSVGKWTSATTPATASNQVPMTLQLICFTPLKGLAALLVLGTLIWLLLKVRDSADRSGLGLLRDRGTVLGAGTAPFSLARFQMVWWFGLIFASYVFLWIVYDELPAISKSALMLLGLAGSTGLVATSIDNAAGQTIEPSQGWFSDIANDGQGVAIHRFQLLVWTLFFGLVFVAQVAGTLTIPEFDSTTLALMGLSSVTYVGFKTTEKRTPDASAGKDSAVAPTEQSDRKPGYGVACDAPE